MNLCQLSIRLTSMALLLYHGGLFGGVSNDKVVAAELSAIAQLPRTQLPRKQHPQTQPSGNMGYRRVFVPADSPEVWPVGSERFLPIPRAEFSRLVAQDQSRPASQQQVPVHVSRAVYRAELVSDDMLQGEAEWSVELLGKEPRLLPLAPLNLAIQSAGWRRDPKREASVGLWARNDAGMDLAVLANQSDTLQLQWQLAAQRVDSASADFMIQAPIFVPQTLELRLPANRSATLSGSELLRAPDEIGPLGETLWIFQLAARETHQIQINHGTLTKTTRRKPLVSQSTSYQLEPSGLTVVTQLRLDARDSSISELKAAMASGLRIAEVTIDQQPVAWRVVDSAEGNALIISRPESSQPQSVEIRCLAKFRSDTPWELPKLRFEDLAWTEGTTRVLVSPKLELRQITPSQSTLQHIVGISDVAREGEVLRLQEWSQEAAVEIEVGRPLPSLSVRTVTTIELGLDESSASLVADLSSSGGEVYQVQAAIAAGWSVDSVITTPLSALNEWHIDRDDKSSRLRFQLSQPISKESALRVEIKLRRTTGKSVLPATVGQLKLLRFLGTSADHQLLQLRSRKFEQLALADRLERARLRRDEITLEYSDLLPQSPAGPLIDVSNLNEAEVVEFRQQPARYEANLQIEIDALPDSFQHHYRIDCRLLSGAVSEMVLELDEPLPETVRWAFVGQRGIITAERIDAVVSKNNTEAITEQTTPEAWQSSTATYHLRFPTAMTENFRLQADYSLPAQPIERCNLIRLPQSIDWDGQVLLRGALEGFYVADHGWTPAIYANNAVENGRLPVLGTYRLGPEEFRRGSTPSRLRLQRQRQDLPAPQMIAWLAEYRTLQAAGGAAIHTASYSLENLENGEAEIVIPEGAELQEVWLDNRQLEPKQISSEGNVNRLRIGSEQQWPYLVLKYTTRGAPLGGSASIQPVVPHCSFPVNEGRWTLWAPEQYEIDGTQHDDSSHRHHWWQRVFGPLARSRGGTVFNPMSPKSWSQLWSAPLVSQQTKQIAEKLASQLVDRLEKESSQTVGTLLSELSDENQLAQRLFVDRTAMLARGIQAGTPCQELMTASRTARSLNALALPLSSHGLALLVSPGVILLTTAERVAHWHDQLRPTETSGVFMVSSDELADRIETIRSSRTTNVVDILQWQNSLPVESPHWTGVGVNVLADLGRRAHTVEFVEGLPTLIVRRAFVQRALWYAVVLLTLVLGVWQLAHFPNVMIFIGALAGSACLTVPANWLTIPQALFLGLVAAAIVRLTMKSLQIGEARGGNIRKMAPAITMRSLSAVLIGFSSTGPLAHAQPLATSESIAVVENKLPLVLLPIDFQGRQHGKDLYVSEELLEILQRPPRQDIADGAQLALLSASYRGSLPDDLEDLLPDGNESRTEPWTLRWKVESFLPNSRLYLPLRSDEAIWDDHAHRLDGVPVNLDWQLDGNGCSVVLPRAGIHWLQVEGQPRFVAKDRSARLELHVPSLPGAALDLSLAPNVDNLQVSGASRTTLTSQAAIRSARAQWQHLLGAGDTIDVRWASKRAKSSVASWERLEQLSWLHVDPAAARLDVQLSLQGLQSPALLLELDVSAQLRIVPPGEDSPIAEVILPTPSHPTRHQLKLRPGIPANFVIPLRFELQRQVSVGTIFFPRVRLQGSSPAQNLFAVSVAAGLSYDEKVSSNVRSIKPAEFSASWDTVDEEPHYVYALGQEDPEWSLRIWPDPRSFSAQQTLRVLCLPNGASVDFEAAIDELAGPRLSHRIQVPAHVQIDSIKVQSPVEAYAVPVRWSRSRVNEAEVTVFFGRPLQQPHVLKLQGHINATTDNELELPQVQLLGGGRGEIHLDLFRAEDVRVRWLDPERIPKEIQQQRVFHGREEIHIGHFSWRSWETGELSRLRLERNDQQFATTSVTTVDLEAAGCTACLNSRLTVGKGVLSRLSLTVPSSFQPPYVLQPEQVGVIDEIRETPGGNEITLLLTQPATEGDEIEVRLTGNLVLPADQHLAVPSLQWKGATRRDRFVLLPTLLDGKSIEWQTSGLRRHALPRQLSSYATQREAALPFHIEQDQFEAKERLHRGAMRNALVRYAKVSAIIDKARLLSATAELVLQPGRSTSCSLQLPPHSQLIQLIVGDHAVRRELLMDNSWQVILGPPFLPQRIVVHYRCQLELSGQRLQLDAPKILLGNQALPPPQTWWRIRAASDLQLGKTNVGRAVDKLQFTTETYRLPLLALTDALSPALELPREEGRAWLQTWQSVIRKAEVDWQAYDLSESERRDLSSARQSRLRLVEAFVTDDTSMANRQISLAYPPRLPWSPEASPTDKALFFVSNSSGQLALTVVPSSKKDLWCWFAAVALVGGALAVVLRLRHDPQWHHKLCHWPHSLALGSGFVWWLLLEPSAIGMLIIALALTSLAIKQWRLFRLRRSANTATGPLSSLLS